MRFLAIGAIASTSATLLLTLNGWPVQAQGIVPAADGTGTQVTPNGPEHIITGGSTAGDQQNLFHRFTDFNLLTGETATFITQPEILNILSGVTGNNPSLIDGLLQVSGSNANLFLINPNGILLGPNSALNLQGSFTATTADQVNFADGLLDLAGTSDYATLVGSPQSFGFTLENPASVVNAGDLAVAPGETILLLGGQVLNTGTLTAPGGEIVISAVEGSNLVRITQTGSLLNLELATLATADGGATPFSPLTLPELLTGSAIAAATNVTVNADGTVELAAGQTVNPASGNITATGLLDVAAAQGGQVLFYGENIALPAGLVDISGTDLGGRLAVYATNRLTLGAAVNAAGAGQVLFDPPTFTVNAPEAFTIVSALNTAGSATVEASETININAAIDTSTAVDPPVGALILRDENADGNLLINLNAPIRLSPSHTLTGDGSVVNVATTGLVQNALNVVLERATINLAAGTFQPGETLFLSDGITLNGAGADNTVLSGNNQSPVVSVTASSAGNALPVTISNLTIANGTSPDSGAAASAILATSPLTTASFVTILPPLKVGALRIFAFPQG